MNKKAILNLLENYQPSFSEEIKFKTEIIDFVEKNDDFALRTNRIGQITGSAWVVNKNRTKVLLIHHKKLDKWLQIGGHIEELDQTIAQTVLREVKEESGLQNITLLSPLVYDIDIHTIPQKKEIAEHLHFDIRLLAEADENEPLLPQNNEVLDIKWCSLEEARQLIKATSYRQSMQRMIEKMVEY